LVHFSVPFFVVRYSLFVKMGAAGNLEAAPLLYILFLFLSIRNMILKNEKQQ